MAESALTLEVCAPDRAPQRIEVTEVTVPGTVSPFMVLQGHAPLLSTLQIGELLAKDTEGKEHVFAIGGGFCQVLKDRVLILAQSYEQDAEIDGDRAKSSRYRAEDRLEHHRDNIDVARAELALRRALLRMQLASRGGPQGLSQ